VLNPEHLVAEASRRFDEGGPGMLVERHRYALTRHHGDCRLAQILSNVHERLQPLR